MSRAVLKEAVKAANDPSDRLLILKVVVPPTHSDDLNRHRALVPVSHDDLRALISEFSFLGAWNHQEIEGDPRTVIVLTAAKLNADVVVIGARGHGLERIGMDTMPLGSVASYVLSNCASTTLVVKR